MVVNYSPPWSYTHHTASDTVAGDSGGEEKQHRDDGRAICLRVAGGRGPQTRDALRLRERGRGGCIYTTARVQQTRVKIVGPATKQAGDVQRQRSKSAESWGDVQTAQSRWGTNSAVHRSGAAATAACISPPLWMPQQIVEMRVYGRVDPSDLTAKANVALALCYFAIGFVTAFTTTPLNVYMVEILDASPQIQNTIGVLSTLPWSFKVAFGFLSDSVPIAGLHRKPYLIGGCAIFSLSYVLYAISALHSAQALAAAVFFGTFGLILIDVMADTMCVERSKFEPDATRGQMQATCYSIRFFGSICGACLGTLICSKDVSFLSFLYLDFAQVSFLTGLIPILLIAPWLYQLKEVYVPRDSYDYDPPSSSYGSLGTKKHPGHSPINVMPFNVQANVQAPGGRGDIDRLRAYAPVGGVDGTEVLALSRERQEEEEEQRLLKTLRARNLSVQAQVHEIWETVKLQSVWRPMAFVVLFNLFQVPNVAWQSYLQLTLKFPAWVLGLTTLLGSVMTFSGIVGYKVYFFHASWRSIYFYTALLTAFFSLLQLLLIWQLNVKLGIHNYFFSLGDDVISAYVQGIQFVPICIMYMKLCPEGAEGTTYSMLTTMGNVSLVVASSIGNSVSGIWDVSNDTLRSGNVEGLWRLNLLTSLCSLLPLSLIFLLPRDAKEQDELTKSAVRSVAGGVIFLSVLFLSLGWTLSRAIMDII